MWRKWLFAMLVAGMSLSFLQPAVANASVDEQVMWTRPTWDTQAVQTWGMYANDTTIAGGYKSYLMGIDATAESRDALIESVALCDSMKDQACVAADFVRYNAVIPMCSEAITADCIEGIVAKNETGTALPVNMQGVFAGMTDRLIGDASLSLPSAGSAILFSIEGITHNGGNQFAAVVSMFGDKLKSESKFQLREFRAQIYAVRQVEGQFSPIQISTDNAQYRGSPLLKGSGSGGTAPCIMTTTSTCILPYSLPMDISFGLTMRFSTPITGWFHGRIRDAATAVSIESDGSQKISIQAKPVQEPAYNATIKASEAHPDLQKYYESLPVSRRGGMGLGCRPGVASPCTVEDWWSFVRLVNTGADILEEFGMWLNKVSDKAAAMPSVWLLASTNSSGSACYGNPSLSGIVATNATAYAYGPPRFNVATQSLDYTVAAPHYAPDGITAIRGTYDLLLRSDVARCLYGFGSAPVSATISVLADSGVEQAAAVTTVSEKDGWMRLAASGFTFSTPTVRVKLTQEPAPTAVVPKSTTSDTASKSKRTITCVKGKVAKKVTGKNPKCPAGFKKR